MILGGTVSYEDAIKKDPGDQYSTSRKVRVELNFAVPEDPGIDPEAVLSGVMEKAINLTNEKLGLTTSTRAAKSVVIDPAPAAKTKADLEAEAVAKVGGEPKKRGPKPKVAEKPAEDWDTGNAPVPAEASASSENATLASVQDEWSAEPVKEISDADLNKAVGDKNTTLKDPPKIRALLATFNPDPKKPFTLREIKQEQRQTFLDKLKAL